MSRPKGSRNKPKGARALFVKHHETPTESQAPGDMALSLIGPQVDMFVCGMVAAGTPAPVEEERNPRFWPEDESLPKSYKKYFRPATPCPKCRRVLTDEGGQAAACLSSGRDVAVFRCKMCGHRWQLGVEEVG